MESICIFDPVNQHPISHLKRTVLKDIVDVQVSDNINFKEHSSPVVSVFCKVREGMLYLEGSNKKRMLIYFFLFFLTLKTLVQKRVCWDQSFWVF